MLIEVKKDENKGSFYNVEFIKTMWDEKDKNYDFCIKNISVIIACLSALFNDNDIFNDGDLKEKSIEYLKFLKSYLGYTHERN